MICVPGVEPLCTSGVRFCAACVCVCECGDGRWICACACACSCACVCTCACCAYLRVRELVEFVSPIPEMEEEKEEGEHTVARGQHPRRNAPPSRLQP